MLLKLFKRQALLIPKRALHNKEKNKDALRIGIVGVPFNKGQPKSGVEYGPDAIRQAGLFTMIKTALEEHIDVKDYGDISYEIKDENVSVDNMRSYSYVASCAKAISNRVDQIIQDNRICITLGGDHSIAIGTIDGHFKAKSDNVSVLWVDAHADINTNLTSGSGNVHGMPVGLLVKELANFWPYLPGMDWQKPKLPAKNLAYIGLRDVDKFEEVIIDELGISAYGIAEVDNYGITKVVQKALKDIDPEKNRSIHVSFDIDSLDQVEAPSTGTSVRGGLTLREGITIMETVAETGRLGAIDLVEVNPYIGNEDEVNRTVEAAINIILAGLGVKRQGLRSFERGKIQIPKPPPTRTIIN